MSARISLTTAIAGLCLLVSPGMVRADDLGSLLIDLPLPQPVETVDPSQTCVEPDAVMLQLKTEAATLGGKAAAMNGTLDQRFSDEWRRRIHEASVPVGLILIHAFANPADDDEMLVDTIEFDPDGCALSRTLLPLDAWSALVRAAEGTPA